MASSCRQESGDGGIVSSSVENQAYGITSVGGNNGYDNGVVREQLPRILQQLYCGAANFCLAGIGTNVSAILDGVILVAVGVGPSKLTAVFCVGRRRLARGGTQYPEFVAYTRLALGFSTVSCCFEV